jgi:hypothetical protein
VTAPHVPLSLLDLAPVGEGLLAGRHDPAARLRSCRLVAEAAGLVPAGADAGSVSVLENRVVG